MRPEVSVTLPVIVPEPLARMPIVSPTVKAFWKFMVPAEAEMVPFPDSPVTVMVPAPASSRPPASAALMEPALERTAPELTV